MVYYRFLCDVAIFHYKEKSPFWGLNSPYIKQSINFKLKRQSLDDTFFWNNVFLKTAGIA